MITNNTTPIKINDPMYFNLFSNLQGNILKPHGRTFSNHIFITFKNDKVEEAKAFIASLAENKITYFHKQIEQHEEFNKNNIDKKTFCNIYFTALFYKYLGENMKQHFEASFTNQMKEADLNDSPVDASWNNIHIMILVANADEKIIEEETKVILDTISDLIIKSFVEKGNKLKINREISDKEHFGYKDGISNPIFLDENKRDINYFDDFAPLALALVQDPFVTNPDAYGSYLVFRKLEQNVNLFKKIEDEIEKKFEIDGGALLIGRFENGVPVVLSNDVESNTEMNDFDFTNDITGSKCPMHAHIRVTNPRDDSSKSHRIIRRAIPYGDYIDKPEPKPTKGVGLLFMCFQSSIANQFEFIQKNANSINQFDSIIGQNNSDINTFSFAKIYGDPTSLCNYDIPKLVTFKGGEYFFAPSKPYLNGLKNSLV
ncbi:putative Multifunctional dye peroxidase DyP2 [Flavobacterium sp. 9AF]|uniref:Dyp-type peroxidase n=1 Tax=Flavobacterium sp. 9AF TaxID=2653142 RepID=UPI0012F38AF8|nr:Dyp-type peroxidase [Flavobacterium sp. 9AF]VXB84822.1 putative Multifunctional dye peroxidase DyP2 [Flavobacterium sp. 9AF]